MNNILKCLQCLSIQSVQLFSVQLSAIILSYLFKESYGSLVTFMWPLAGTKYICTTHSTLNNHHKCFQLYYSFIMLFLFSQTCKIYIKAKCMFVSNVNGLTSWILLLIAFLRTTQQIHTPWFLDNTVSAVPVPCLFPGHLLTAFSRNIQQNYTLNTTSLGSLAIKCLGVKSMNDCGD